MYAKSLYILAKCGWSGPFEICNNVQESEYSLSFFLYSSKGISSNSTPTYILNEGLNLFSFSAYYSKNSLACLNFYLPSYKNSSYFFVSSLYTHTKIFYFFLSGVLEYQV